MKMTIKEAEANLVRFSSDYFVKYTNNFDYGLIVLDYATLRDDFFTGESKRKYTTGTGHAWQDLLEFIREARLLADSINIVCKSEYQTNMLKRYSWLFDKLDRRFADYCKNHTIIWF